MEVREHARLREVHLALVLAAACMRPSQLDL